MGMTRQELIDAMDQGLPVKWMNSGYDCYKDTEGQYIKASRSSGHTIGIFHKDNIGMNIDAEDCYISTATWTNL